jgi:RNA polymerase sigma-70 factor (ECF subfamily)
MNVSAVPAGSEGEPSRAGREVEAQHLADLMARSSRGQEDAFAELYDLTSRRIYAVILRVLRSADHAAEVTQ